METTTGRQTELQMVLFFLRRDIVSPAACILKTRSKYESAFKSYVSFELAGFPCKPCGILSDSQPFELELYKAAD